MNENPGGTPNPLNPLAPSQPQPQPGASRPISTEVPDGGSTSGVAAMRSEPLLQNAAPTRDTSPLQSTTPTQTSPSTDSFSSFNPAARPMEKAPEPVPVQPKKKNIWLIIGAAICGVIALGCLIAAIVVALTTNQVDPVARAVGKIMSGDVPTNTSVDGAVKITINDTDSDYKDANVTVKSQIVNGTMINSSKASLTANLRNGASFTVGLDEVYATTGDLFLKVNGLVNALDAGQSSTSQDNTVVESDTKCVDDGTGLANCDSEIVEPEDDSSSILQSLSMFAAMLESIDNQWIRLSADDLNSMTSTENGNILSCITNLGGSVNNNKNTISDLYSKYPFISSSNEDLPVSSEKNPIYKVVFDSKNINSFLTEAQNTNIFRDFSSCMGYKNSVDSNELMEEIEELPTLYVEIDDNYDFTRLYFTVTEDEMDYVYDFDLSYPENVNISEPTDYKDFTEIMQGMFSEPMVTENPTPTNQIAF